MELHEKDDLKDILPTKDSGRLFVLPPLKDWEFTHYEEDITLLNNISIKCCKTHLIPPSYSVIEITVDKTHYTRHGLNCGKCKTSGLKRQPMFMFNLEGMIEYWNATNGAK